jgi:hypothetical protein
MKNDRWLQRALLLCCIAGLFSQAAYAQPVEIPEIIDLGKGTASCSNTDAALYQMGALAFNQSPEVASIVTYLKSHYQLQDAVETGTYEGNTTMFLSLLFDKVYSFEILESMHERSKKSLAGQENIELILGSSGKNLVPLLAKLKGRRVLFYLDAHWHDYWPLLDELKAIAKTHKDQCVILIDDAYVPKFKGIPHDSYKGQRLSYDYIKATLPDIFSAHTVHYILPHHRDHRAKMLLLPANFVPAKP